MIIGQVPTDISESTKARIFSPYWPWFMCSHTTEYNPEYNDSIRDELSGEDPQFMHTVMDNQGEMRSENAYEQGCQQVWEWILNDSEIFEEFSDAEFNKLRRIKMNLLTRKETKHLYHTPHVDFDRPHWTLIYYVNDSYGGTYFFKQKYNGTRQKLEIDKVVEPRQGRFVLFDGLTYHTSSNPQYHDTRCVINFNFV